MSISNTAAQSSAVFADHAGNSYTAYSTTQAAAAALVAALAGGDFHDDAEAETLADYDEFTVGEYIAEGTNISYFYVNVGNGNGGTHTDRRGFNDFVSTNGKDEAFSCYKNFDCDDYRSKLPIESCAIGTVRSVGGQLYIDATITLYSGEQLPADVCNEIDDIADLDCLAVGNNPRLEDALGENYCEAVSFELQKAAKAEYGDLETLLAAAAKA